MPGPLPDPKRRRRNAPTIPTTRLLASGRGEPAPRCPYRLGSAGRAWWRWAWALPQALAWDDGALYVVARRARLEDDAAALDGPVGVELAAVLEGADGAAIERVGAALGALRRLAGGKLGIEKEMRELDGKLGLTPEAMAKLRWTIISDQPAVESPAADAQPKRRAARPGRPDLRAVDPALAESG